MKTLIVSCVVLSVMVVLSDALSATHKYSDDFEDALVQCLEEMKITKENFTKMAEDEEGQFACILACANKKNNVFDGTTYNAEKIHEHITKEMAKKQHEYTADLKARMNKCIESANTAEGDECEKTVVFFKCIMDDEELMKMVELGDDSDEAEEKEEVKEEVAESLVPA